MFQKILAVVDRQDDRQMLQNLLQFSQHNGAKLTLLHVLNVSDESMLLLLSDLERQKYWAGTNLMNWNVWNHQDRSPKQVRPKTKLKVEANVATLEPSVLNDQKFDRISTTSLSSRNLEQAIVGIAQRCKADLIVISLSQNSSIEFPAVCCDVMQMAHCSVLILKDEERLAA